jgi:SAM-dependent methyltransferase
MSDPASESVGDALAGVKALYTDNLAQHGLASQSVGWRDEASQRLRFDKLAMVLDGADPQQPISVSDFGCGYGAMFSHLDERNRPPIERYVGYDISEPMLEAAARHCDDSRVVLVQGSEPSEITDYAFVSGTFNVRMGASDEAWESHVHDTLVALAGSVRRGLAFNLLTSYVDWRQEDLYYADPRKFFHFCRRELARYVTLVHDYPLYEWTILVHKERA